MHAPLQAPAADIERFQGRYEAGWDVLRAERFERQKELGVVPPHAVLPPRNTEERHEVGPWDDLDDRSKELFARYMEVYAGMVHNVDRNFGRLRRHLEAIGEWDNTIVLFTSDNGGSREGQYTGMSAYFRTLLTRVRSSELEVVDVDYERIDLLGGPRTLAHYPMGWAMVSCTPFRLYKINTHRGGHSVPFIVNWPARFVGDGAAVNAVLADRAASTATAGRWSPAASPADHSATTAGSCTIWRRTPPSPATWPPSTPTSLRNSSKRGTTQPGPTRCTPSTRATSLPGFCARPGTRSWLPRPGCVPARPPLSAGAPSSSSSRRTSTSMWPCAGGPATRACSWRTATRAAATPSTWRTTACCSPTTPTAT